jgi:pimeloyl-ACP methyl ester carboxylesterase
MQQKFASNNSIELYTESFGNPSSPPLLLVAGSMCSGRFWTDDFCKIFVDNGYFVIRYDHRDTGLSSSVDYQKNPYSIYNLALDALAVLNAYSIKKAHILGASMGGAICQMIALYHQEYLLSLTLAASASLAQVSLTDEEQSLLFQQALDLSKNKPSKDFLSSLEGFLTTWQSLHGDIPIDKDIATTFTKDMYTRTKPEHLDWLDKLSQGIDPAHNHERVMEHILDCQHDLKNIHVPVSVIHGEKDRLIPIRTIQEYFVRHVSQSKMHSIPHMGHIVFNKSIFEKIALIFLENQKKEKSYTQIT